MFCFEKLKINYLFNQQPFFQFHIIVTNSISSLKSLTFAGTSLSECESSSLIRGRDGRDGKDGESGRDGHDGKDGERGRDGRDGERGQKGEGETL